MTEQQRDRYAELLLWCIGGADGRRILVQTETVHREFAVQVARAAYTAGAALVVIDYTEPLLVRARTELANEDCLALHADYQRERYRELSTTDWSLIRVHGSLEPDYLAGLDPVRIAVYSKSFREMAMPVLEQVTRFNKHWVGCLYPTSALAAAACPELEPSEAVRRYERELIRVLSLDDPDPVSVWKGTFRELSRRRDRMNSLRFDTLHFTGPGTDLEIGLHNEGRWATAEAVMTDGRTVCVNMPSLEVFTTPDLRRTNGRVASSRPYVSTTSPGSLISGAWFEFRDGAVVDSGADTGGEILSTVLNMDPQARYLGEIALVDSRSAVAQAGFTFFDTLYDENAATHIALGRGFPPFIEGAADLATDELIARGINHSMVHDDVMIGSPEMDIDGRTLAGEIIPVMRSGRFVDAE